MLRGKTAIVTGSTSGIGLGIAEALARAGAAVVLNGFGRPEDVKALCDRLSAQYGVAARFSPADMRRAADVEAMVAETIDADGAVDILINNAGIQHVAPVDQFPIEKWDEILAVNLTSAFLATRFALPSMRARGWGRIVNIASAHGLVASPFKSAYIAAKHGVVGFTKTVALETARDGITCNTICPGYVLTPLVEKQIDDQAQTHGIPRDEVVERIMLERQPTKRFVGIDEVAALAVYLCSDVASSITGAQLSVDGGWVAQ